MANDGDAADVAAIVACLRDAMQRKDLAVALSLMTDDIVVVPPVGPSIAGLDAVRALTAEPRLSWFKLELDVEHAFGDATVEILGEVAVVMSNDSTVVTARDDTFPSVRMSGRVINVFRRRVDGWRLARSVNLMANVRGPKGA
jgi:uncharacterized protein (TIGR02246 family)